MHLQDKVALVTGGTGGIGGAASRRLAGEGAKVVITDMNDQAGNDLASAIGGVYHRLDVTDPQAWKAVVAAVIDQFGHIDVLVQCAGIEGSLKTDVLDVTPELWKRVIDVNLNGTFYGCQAVMPAMLQRGTGSMVLISSIVSFMAAMAAAPYGVSKAGVQHLAKTFALVGARDGAKVRVNSIHPGVIKTRMTDNIIKELAQASAIGEADAEALMAAAVPFGERGDPDDIAHLILYLASDQSRYMTGSELKIDGGWLIKDATS